MWNSHGFHCCSLTATRVQYHDRSRWPAIKRQMIDMALNDSGVRDLVRVLGLSSTTVIATFKKRPPPSSTSLNDDSRREILRQVR